MAILFNRQYITILKNTLSFKQKKNDMCGIRKFAILLVLLIQLQGFTQAVNLYEKAPTFPECASAKIDTLQKCFDRQVFKLIKTNFKTPEHLKTQNYKGEAVVLFEVDTTGHFHVMYVDAIDNTIKEEVRRVFKLFPKIEPATYSGRKTFKQFSIPIKLPLERFTMAASKDLARKTTQQKNALELHTAQEYDNVKKGLKAYTNKALKSQLNVPFTHTDYARFDRAMNVVGTNSHTASKPFLYEDVSKYHDFEAERKTLEKDKDKWLGRKLWNEHLVQVQGKDYWFTVDPIFDLQAGKDFDADFSSTFNNTRGVLIQGGLGKKFNFYSTIFESQGRFADYVNRYAESIRASGPNPAIIPGRGIAKRFKDDAFDYPVAEAYLSYTPVKFLNLQFGHGKNFIGDGYRSLLLSDVASPYPFFKINTTFWKLKYTNTFMSLRDVRDEVIEDGAFLTKYVASHYLSWNASKRLNIGLFESVLWTNSNDRGFDLNYVNPVILYRAIEFATGQDAGNAILGASAKYKFNDNINMYSQFILDEFSLDDIRAGEQSWRNKYGYQLGLKYFNAFKIQNLQLQLEYNRVRPYTYSHNTIVLNYAHNNQSLAHLWGANFSEFIAIGRYKYKRWFADAKLIMGTRGFDFNTPEDGFAYGGDIFTNEEDRPFDTGIEVGQGNTTKSIYGNIKAGYLINPASNLKLFAELTYRDFNPNVDTEANFQNNTLWINFGLRTDIFNWYFDF